MPWLILEASTLWPDLGWGGRIPELQARITWRFMGSYKWSYKSPNIG